TSRSELGAARSRTPRGIERATRRRARVGVDAPPSRRGSARAFRRREAVVTTLEIGMLGAILLPVAGAIALVIADAQPGASALSSRTIALVASLLGALSIALVGASLAADGGVAITGRAAAEGSVARIARETLSRLLRADGPGTFLAAWAAIVAFVTLDLETSSTRDAAGVRSPGGLSRRGRLRVAV